jgi:hypothetical protein
MKTYRGAVATSKEALLERLKHSDDMYTKCPSKKKTASMNPVKTNSVLFKKLWLNHLARRSCAMCGKSPETPNVPTMNFGQTALRLLQNTIASKKEQIY